jgi:hypothetical protein
MPGTSPNNDILIWARASRGLPQPVSDGNPALLRGGRYGEQISELLSLKGDRLLDEGSVYVTRTPTVGTGINMTLTATAYAATTPFIIVTNNNPAGPTSRNVYLDSIKLIGTVPGASGTSVQYATAIDSIARFATYGASGAGAAGTGATNPLSGPYPPNSGAGPNSSTLIYAGTVTAVAASMQARLLESGWLRAVANCPIVGDQYVLNFGGTEAALDTISLATATLIQRSVPHSLVEIQPGHSFLFTLWVPSMAATAAAFEVIIAHHER